MVSLAQLRDSDLSGLLPAATAYDTLATNFGKHVQTMQHEVLKHVLNANWVGNAAGAANASLQRTSNRLDAAHTEMSAVSGLLREASESFLLAQSKLKAALQEAQNLGLTVAEDGTVSWPAPSKAERNDPEYNVPQQARALANRISGAVTEAGNADQKIAGLLNSLTERARNGTGLDTDKAAADLKAVTQQGVDLMAAGFPPAGASPTEVNSWWKGLTPDEQQRLIEAHPDLLGMRDGIPAAARDQANRLNLAHLITKYQQKPNLTDDEKQKLEGFLAISKRLEADKDKQPPRFLLGVSEEGQGRGILSFGNPDTAKNVSAYVPGLGTTLGAVGGKDGDRALNVWNAAHNADPNAEVASMVWLGYDPPPGLEKLADGDTRPLEVMDADRAAKGGAAYDKFMAGLRATHDGSPAHLVALAHSYGSTTVGLGAQMSGGTGADDVILVGSPGTGAAKASQLHIDPGHVWVGDAENDPVSHLPSKGRVANDIQGATGGFLAGPVGSLVGGYVADKMYDWFGPEDQLWFGQDPASKGFGANRFAVADGPELSFDSHSDYMTDPNDSTSKTLESVNNIGQIVAGKYDHVTRQDHR
ncbi:alpha/beta hydrolase [Streptomyces sp. 1331.2]|uniref:alpha/beta hydrolase n=1 Tax=Streptomyces sp. 1331.2 TaxID=1938835 RepID=UPI000BCAA84C|nr:alpha/beta hydrolase [Streptomyces sp. 1331.2]SOB88436.1 Alpha/beta hydrolase [Streptomyces sp. 1331.2]